MCNTKKFFAIACLGKKVSFSYGNLLISPLANFKKVLFHWAKTLFKSDQTWHRVFPWYLVTMEILCAKFDPI